MPFCPNYGSQLTEAIQAPPAFSPPSQTQAPKRWKKGRAWKIAIVVVVIAVLTIALVYYAYLPRVTMTVISTVDAKKSCDALRTPQTVGATFTLVNTGMINATVILRMMGGGGYPNVLGTYVVPVGQSLTGNLSATVDCSLGFKVFINFSAILGGVNRP